MDEYPFKHTTVDTYGESLPGGVFKIIIKVSQRRSKDGKEWETREISSEDVSGDLNRSLMACDFTIQKYLESVEGDLFNEPNDTPNSIKN